jgi:broad specificity phosphatase PhoE
LKIKNKIENKGIIFFMENMAELWLVRHGQTDWNLEGRYQGQTDIPLNPTGIEQAKQLGLSLPRQPYTALYSSDLKRARMTSDILNERFNLPVLVDRRLREINQGDWEGQLVSEVRMHYQEWPTLERRAIFMHPVGGEAVEDVAARMTAVVEEIARNHPGQKVLVVSHGLAIATLICQVKGISLDRVYSQIPENAQPTRMIWTQKGSLTSA